MSMQIGQLLDHYRIVGKIGEGGMGEVWRARDERLHRDVAVKVLPADVAGDPGRLARFEREARTLASLSHPNIVAIHEFGQAQGIAYAVTELLQGETLRERLKGGAIGWRRSVEITVAVADGLAAAHGRGVVHRDLKPENVFLTSDGQVKVLDFGLARLRSFELPVTFETEMPTESLLTVPGTVLGTLGYMAPEQARGQPVDARSDIFALGCVAHEMLCRKRTFARDSAAETMAAILKEEPPDVSSCGEDIPIGLAGIVRRCLEKQPEARFQSASDLAYDLRMIAGASVTPTVRPISEARGWRRLQPWVAVGVVIVAAAVLTIALREPPVGKVSVTLPEVLPNRVAVVPLENRTGDPSLDSLGVLAADLIVQRFTETAAAEVAPLSEALEELPSVGLQGSQTPGWSHVLQLARQRGAGVVLAGAVYLDGQALRLQARLVDTTTGDLVYAFEPVSAAREEAATGIDTLRERLVAAVAAHGHPLIDISLMTPPSTYAAYQAYQRGQERFDTNDWEGAIPNYRRALEEDPHFHRARLWLGWAFLNSHDDEGVEHQLSMLEEQPDRMTPLDEAEARYQRSVLEWDRVTSLKLLRRMSEIAPEVSYLLEDLPLRALELNRPREAAEFLKRYRAPQHYHTSWWQSSLVTAARHMLGEFPGELESANLGREQHPDRACFFFAKARALAAMGQTEALEEVVGEFLRVQTIGGSAGSLMSATAMELRAHGYRKDADEMALRSVDWFEAHPLATSEEKKALTIELWALGYPEERRSFATALCMVGRWREAEALIVRSLDSEPSTYLLAGWRGVIAANVGDRDGAMRISDELPAGDSARSKAWRIYWQAAIAAHLGDNERAVALLAEAFSRGFPYGVYLHSTLDFEPLWSDPAFQELVAPKG